MEGRKEREGVVEGGSDVVGMWDRWGKENGVQVGIKQKRRRGYVVGNGVNDGMKEERGKRGERVRGWRRERRRGGEG